MKYIFEIHTNPELCDSCGGTDIVCFTLWQIQITLSSIGVIAQYINHIHVK